MTKKTVALISNAHFNVKTSSETLTESESKFTMVSALFCSARLNELVQLVRLHGTFISALCVLNSVFSLVAAIGNLLAIRALWKASMIPSNVKTLFLSLAFSDLAVGMFSQPMYSGIMGMMLNMASTEENDFASFCPTIVSVCYFLMNFLSCASFLNVIAIAVDRLLSILLHLRYEELATSKRVIITLVSLWLTSAIAAFIFIVLPKGSFMVAAIIDFVGLLFTTVAYRRVYKIARSHQNQIQGQLQLQNQIQAMELNRQKKSAYNALFVYFVFLACYLPLVPSIILLQTNSSKISFMIAYHASIFLFQLNSSLNPLVYCWRYREIREIVKSTVKKIIRQNEH